MRPLGVLCVGIVLLGVGQIEAKPVTVSFFTDRTAWEAASVTENFDALAPVSDVAGTHDAGLIDADWTNTGSGLSMGFGSISVDFFDHLPIGSGDGFLGVVSSDPFSRVDFFPTGTITNVIFGVDDLSFASTQTVKPRAVNDPPLGHRRPGRSP